MSPIIYAAVNRQYSLIKACNAQYTHCVFFPGVPFLSLRYDQILQLLRHSLDDAAAHFCQKKLGSVLQKKRRRRKAIPQSLRCCYCVTVLTEPAGELLPIYARFPRKTNVDDVSKNVATLVVGNTMLDKSSDKGEQAGRCSDCGCTLTPPQPDSDPDSANTSASPQQTHALKEDSPSKCPSCQADGSLPNGRRPHRRIRLDPHSCGLCSKTFISSAHLTLHLASHNKERKFRCSTCGKYFHQQSHLMAHKTIHSGDRPFKCQDCGKAFVRASHLKTHRRLHTGEKPFKCTYCDKSFTQKAGLLAHVRLHTGEQSHKCEHCGESFSSLSLLLSHKAKETGEAKPVSAPALSQPQKIQSNPEDLKCGVCCRTFVRSSYIRLQIRLNKGQRPYHCKVCNKTFVKLDTFVNHCDKHLREKRDKSKDVKDKVVKPPMFVPLSRPPPEGSPTQPLSLEVNTRSRTKSKSKTEP